MVGTPLPPPANSAPYLAVQLKQKNEAAERAERGELKRRKQAIEKDILALEKKVARDKVRVVELEKVSDNLKGVSGGTLAGTLGIECQSASDHSY